MTTVATIDAPVAETYAEAVEMRMKIMVGVMKTKINGLLTQDGSWSRNKFFSHN